LTVRLILLLDTLCSVFYLGLVAPNHDVF
jgi:hypothetical protein